MKNKYYAYKASSHSSRLMGCFDIRIEVTRMRYLWLKLTGRTVTKNDEKRTGDLDYPISRTEYL